MKRLHFDLQKKSLHFELLSYFLFFSTSLILDPEVVQPVDLCKNKYEYEWISILLTKITIDTQIVHLQLEYMYGLSL